MKFKKVWCDNGAIKFIDEDGRECNLNAIACSKILSYTDFCIIYEDMIGKKTKYELDPNTNATIFNGEFYP